MHVPFRSNRQHRGAGCPQVCMWRAKGKTGFGPLRTAHLLFNKQSYTVFGMHFLGRMDFPCKCWRLALEVPSVNSELSRPAWEKDELNRMETQGNLQGQCQAGSRGPIYAYFSLWYVKLPSALYAGKTLIRIWIPLLLYLPLLAFEDVKDELSYRWRVALGAIFSPHRLSTLYNIYFFLCFAKSSFKKFMLPQSFKQAVSEIKYVTLKPIILCTQCSRPPSKWKLKLLALCGFGASAGFRCIEFLVCMNMLLAMVCEQSLGLLR